MSLLAKLGSHVSSALHNIVFSLPSSGNKTAADAFNATASAIASAVEGASRGQGGANENGNGNGMSHQELVDMLEPGEAKAIVAGVGAPSFFGSGYGIALIIVVSLPEQNGQRGCSRVSSGTLVFE